MVVGGAALVVLAAGALRIELGRRRERRPAHLAFSVGSALITLALGVVMVSVGLTTS